MNLRNFVSDAVLSIVQKNHPNSVPLGKVPKSRKTIVDFVRSRDVLSKYFKGKCQLSLNIKKTSAKNVFFSRIGYKNIFATKGKTFWKHVKINSIMKVKEACQKLFKQSASCQNDTTWRRLAPNRDICSASDL